MAESSEEPRRSGLHVKLLPPPLTRQLTGSKMMPVVSKLSILLRLSLLLSLLNGGVINAQTSICSSLFGPGFLKTSSAGCGSWLYDVTFYDPNNGEFTHATYYWVYGDCHGQYTNCQCNAVGHMETEGQVWGSMSYWPSPNGGGAVQFKWQEREPWFYLSGCSGGESCSPGYPQEEHVSWTTSIESWAYVYCV